MDKDNLALYYFFYIQHHWNKYTEVCSVPYISQNNYIPAPSNLTQNCAFKGLRTLHDARGMVSKLRNFLYT